MVFFYREITVEKNDVECDGGDGGGISGTYKLCPSIVYSVR